MKNDKLEPGDHPVARKVYEIIFEADTFGGKAFDLALLVAILVSVIAVCLETVESVQSRYTPQLEVIEWTCTILFTLEYFIRIACLKHAKPYVFSFFGIVDLLSFLPAYMTPLSSGARSFAVIRALRLLRIFRILELSWFESEANSLSKAVWESRAKIVIFLVTVLIIVTIAGAAMYEIEWKPESAETPSEFDSIPQAIYWAIITMTTVGYGDIVPLTIAGKFVAALLVLLGYSLIIVPTGFVSAELGGRKQGQRKGGSPDEANSIDANQCPHCGEPLAPSEQD